MIFVRRSKSYRSVFYSTACFNASCAGEPTISHFVLQCALGEMGSCAQQLYSTDESQSCLSLLLEKLGTSVTRHRRPPHMVCHGFYPRREVLAFFLLGFRGVLSQVPHVYPVLNPEVFVLASHECLDTCACQYLQHLQECPYLVLGQDKD